MVLFKLKLKAMEAKKNYLVKKVAQEKVLAQKRAGLDYLKKEKAKYSKKSSSSKKSSADWGKVRKQAQGFFAHAGTVNLLDDKPRRKK